LLNQLSSAASSLKDIYKRRSSTDMISHWLKEDVFSSDQGVFARKERSYTIKGGN
jgi:hypothetical protein